MTAENISIKFKHCRGCFFTQLKKKILERSVYILQRLILMQIKFCVEHREHYLHVNVILA